MSIIKNNSMEIISKEIAVRPSVRKAAHLDIDGIMDVACSVGNSNKIPRVGFLMDDYTQNYNYFKRLFLKLIMELDNFYVIESNSIIGFLIAYTKEQWLIYNPDWLGDIIWSPQFDVKKVDNFVLVDKIAVRNGLTGKGLGSLLYKTLVPNIKKKNVCNLFSETLISPKPNFASLEFRNKQDYKLAGIRYESYKGTVYTDLVYHKQI